MMKSGKQRARYPNGVKVISTTISQELWQLALDKNISWHDAISFGIVQKAAGAPSFAFEKEQLTQGIEKLQKAITRVSARCFLLEDELKKRQLPIPEEVKGGED